MLYPHLKKQSSEPLVYVSDAELDGKDRRKMGRYATISLLIALIALVARQLAFEVVGVIATPMVLVFGIAAMWLGGVWVYYRRKGDAIASLQFEKSRVSTRHVNGRRANYQLQAGERIRMSSHKVVISIVLPRRFERELVYQVVNEPVEDHIAYVLKAIGLEVAEDWEHVTEDLDVARRRLIRTSEVEIEASGLVSGNDAPTVAPLNLSSFQFFYVSVSRNRLKVSAAYGKPRITVSPGLAVVRGGLLPKLKLRPAENQGFRWIKTANTQSDTTQDLPAAAIQIISHSGKPMTLHTANLMTYSDIVYTQDLYDEAERLCQLLNELFHRTG